MKNRGEGGRNPGEGRLLAAVLGLVLAFCLFVCLKRIPVPMDILPVHNVSYDELHRAELADINAADVQKLARLPGVGEELARRIIAYRDEKGGFSAAEELMEVPGIGEGKFEKIRNLIYIG